MPSYYDRAMQIELRVRGYANDIKFEKFILLSCYARKMGQLKAGFNKHLHIQGEG